MLSAGNQPSRDLLTQAGGGGDLRSRNRRIFDKSRRQVRLISSLLGLKFKSARDDWKCQRKTPPNSHFIQAERRPEQSALKPGDSDGFAQSLKETEGAGQPGSNSAHLCSCGPCVGLFIISTQHTQTWNIAPLSHWVLPAGKKRGAWRCRRNANECPLCSPRLCLVLQLHCSPAERRRPCPGSDCNVSSRSLRSDTTPHVLAINQRLQPH